MKCACEDQGKMCERDVSICCVFEPHATTPEMLNDFVNEVHNRPVFMELQFKFLQIALAACTSS